MNADQMLVFRRAIEAENSGAEENVDDRMLIDESDVSETHDSIENFTSKWGTPASSAEYFGVTLHHWTAVQARKGARRGDLYVADFGDSRLAHFDGEA